LAEKEAAWLAKESQLVAELRALKSSRQTEVAVEKIVEVPVEKIVEVHVEKIVEVPVEKIVKVEVPVEKIVSAGMIMLHSSVHSTFCE
jgi:hypothetical protein